MSEPAAAELPLIEVLPRDISAYRKGNRGVDYVHTLESGQPGPHVIVNGLTHGNEFCGMTAVTHLLDSGFRPLRGKLTLSLSNVDAYHLFDAAKPFDSRYVERDFNRLWDDALLDGPTPGSDLDRARALRPIFTEADALLDLHSTSSAMPPMLIYQPMAKYQPLSAHMHSPLHHVLLRGVKHAGRPLIQYGAYGDADAAPLGIVVECGQHFAKSAGDVAIGVAIRFLDFFGMAPRALADQHPALPGEPKRYEIEQSVVSKSEQFRFARRWVGFEELQEGELIATDGDVEFRAPFPRCTIVMPSGRVTVGRDMVLLARPV